MTFARKTIDRIKKKARQSICTFKVAALGFNKSGICVMARTNKPRFSRPSGGLHAEARIFPEARKRGIVRILICRVSANTGELLPIDPCSKCQKIADKLGIVLQTINRSD